MMARSGILFNEICLQRLQFLTQHVRSSKKITDIPTHLVRFASTQQKSASSCHREAANRKRLNEVVSFRGRAENHFLLANRCFSTTRLKLGLEPTGGEKPDKTEDVNPEKPLTQRQKLARIFAAYGTTAVVFHTCISLTSLGTCYMIVSSGIDMVSLLEKVGIASQAGLQSTLASGASTFVIAYACHKVFMPVRIFLTVTCTPIIVRKLRSIGILKEKAKSDPKNIT